MEQPAFLDALSSQTRGLTQRLEAAAHAFDDDVWETATEGAWSPAGIVRHMVLANAPYLAILPAVIDSAPRSSSGAVTHTIVGRLLLKFAGPDGNAPAPKAMHPGPGPFGREVLAEWRSQQDQILALIEEARSIDASRTRFANPFLPLLRMSAVDALAVFAAHTERHVRQIEARLRQ